MSMTIEEMWDSYRKIVVSQDAGPAQLKDMRICFFGAATAILEVITQTIPRLSDRDGMALIGRYIDEVNEFRVEMLLNAAVKRHEPKHQ